jgi:hypothetical protein
MRTPEKTAIVLLPGMDGTGELLRTLAEQLREFGCDGFAI